MVVILANEIIIEELNKGAFGFLYIFKCFVAIEPHECFSLYSQILYSN